MIPVSLPQRWQTENLTVANAAVSDRIPIITDVWKAAFPKARLTTFSIYLKKSVPK
jgi:hypothetical protein